MDFFEQNIFGRKGFFSRYLLADVPLGTTFQILRVKEKDLTPHPVQ
jgi:hypothetical protein